AAIDTIIVSPIALERPSTTAAPTPEIAAGNTTLDTVSNLVAPIPSEPSLIEFGTEDNASSVKLAIIGKIIIPTTIPGLRALKWFSGGMKLCKKGVTNVIANAPET